MSSVDMTEALAKSTNIEEAEANFEKFFKTNYNDELLKIAQGYPEVNSLAVDFHKLEKYDIMLADGLLTNPDFVLSMAEKALRNIDLPVDAPSLRINVRFENLPPSQRIMIRDLRSEDVGRFLVVEGIVRKATDVRPKLTIGAFECQTCGSIVYLEQNETKLKEPFICESCEKKGPFKLLVQESTFIDSQKLMMQETLEDLRGGEHPKQLTIYLNDDLTGEINPGDRVGITGSMRATMKNVGKGNTKSRDFELSIDANSFEPVELEFEEVKISKEDLEEIMELSRDPEVYNKIRDSIAPHIYGYNEIKEAIMYQLFSSPALKLPDGGKVRGDSHIIIMGEPATGKSEILQYVAKTLAPRGVYTSGKGTSAAGLTAAAIKDDFGDGGWSLEAGALVLADKGIACIDEFDKMEVNDRSAMHEAMEQQTVSIAKAGMLATFSARCSILAAANPKYGRFDDYRPISEQINLPPSLLSRFDLIFFVRDELEDTEKVAKHVLDTLVSPEKAEPEILPEVLRKYIAYARQHVFPTLTDEARESIERFYVDMRAKAKDADDVPIPLTARQLWAILRLARASARVRFSNETTVEDAERAIKLVRLSLEQAGFDMESGAFDIDKIMVGVTKSQRDRLTHVLDIIRELEREFNAPVMKSEIMERGLKDGISEKEVESSIDRLKQDGQIYDPNRNGRYKVV